jgi:hypothetical protein
MKRFFLVLVVLMVTMALAGAGVSAKALDSNGSVVDPGIVTADVYVDQGQLPDTNTNANASYLQVGSDSECTSTNATSWAYLRWNLSSWAGKTVQSARIELTSTFAQFQPLTVGYAFTLFKVADDTWDETLMVFNPLATLPNTPPPAFNPTTDAIETFTVLSGDTSGVVTFQSPALATYVGEQLLLDGKASFAFRMTACPGAGSGDTALFDDKENGSSTLLSAAASSTSPNAITVPYLTVGTTAVTMSTFRAVDSAVNWPLIAGLGVLIVVGGVWVYRRRAATRA